MRRSRRTLLAIGAAALALPAVAGVVLERRAARDWAALDLRVERVRSELPHGCRPVLRGDPEPGEAFARYTEACRIALAQDLHCGTLPTATLASLADETPEQREQRHAFLARARPVLEQLDLGARSRRAAAPVDWEAEEHEWPWAVTPLRVERGTHGAIFLGGSDLPRLGFQVLLSELREGRGDAALAVLLDLLQLARDLAASPLPCESTWGAELLVTRDHMVLGAQGGWSRLAPEQLDRYVDALATVDDGLESLGCSGAVGLALEARCLEAYLRRGATWDERLLKTVAAPLTAHASRRARDTYLMLLEHVRDRAAAFAADPVDGLERLGRAWAERRTAGTLPAAFPSADLEQVGASIEELDFRAARRLAGLARLRLLRRALCELAGRDDGPRVDRRGRPIRCEVREGTLRVFLEAAVDGGPDDGLEVRVPAPSSAL